MAQLPPDPDTAAATTTANQLPVLVIGSGTTGLALAQGLRKAGIPCTVFEKSSPTSHARDRDWNMGLHWGAPLLQTLMPEDWSSQIQSLQVDPHVPTNPEDTLHFLQGSTGDIMTSFTFGPFYRLRRSKLRALLSTDLHLEYNKRLTRITYHNTANADTDDNTTSTPSSPSSSVTAHFSDGTSATGSLLVGADGARSTTRQLLLGPDKGTINRIPYAATFVQRRFTKEQALHLRTFHPLFLGSVHPENHFAFFGMQDAADPDDPASWTFFFYISWQSSLEEQDATAHWTDQQRLAQQKEFATKFCDPWKSAYAWTPDDAPVWYMGLTDWDPGLEGHRWDNHNGLVTLVGDAAHPMTYQRGQGLNHSITDAAKLRDVLVKRSEGGDSLSSSRDLITAFEDEVIERGGKEVRDCTTNTAFLHDWEKVQQSPLFTKGLKKE